MQQPLSDKTKALIVALIIVTATFFVAWWSGGPLLAISMCAAQLFVIYVAKNIWASDKSNFLLRSATLGIISGVVLLSNSTLYSLAVQMVEYLGWKIKLPDFSTSPLVLLFLLLLALTVFHYTRDTSVIEKPTKRIRDLIEGPTPKQKWENVCENLSKLIRDIDLSTNWSPEEYTPLEAEVEIETSKGMVKVVKDLLEAIKQSDDRLLLLIGDPGSGKSVALRKLCLDILKTSVKNEYIPIYVNLKEWTSKKDWLREKPTWQDLEAFVKQSLTDKNRYLGDFFEQYYHVLDENGNLFFILDSFDEIPQVLGVSADSELIEDLSKVCREFLQGAKQRRSRGILSSREYRMPRADYFGAKTLLRIRPFSFEKIEQSLRQVSRVPEGIVQELMKQKPELMPSLRNPFVASLLKSYLNDNNLRFPQNQSELFEDYIHKAIERAQKRKGLEHIPYEEIIDVAIQIAILIFTEVGLQAPISLLRQKITHPEFERIVEILRYTHIARGDISQAHEFSFSHRRFYEYFVVQDLIRKGYSSLPLKSIPTDSKWRDTLVLYCEVAPFEKAKRIANYCWYEIIQPANNIRDRGSKHCLRFLTEAFRGRKECLADFTSDLAQYLQRVIEGKGNIIDMKLAAECIGILEEKAIDTLSVLILSERNAWLNETVLRGSRHLTTISTDLEEALEKILFKYSNLSFSKKGIKSNLFGEMSGRELIASLSLSDAFEYLRLRLKFLEKKDKVTSIFLGFIWITTLTALIAFSNKLRLSLLPDPFLIVFMLFGTWYIFDLLLHELVLRLMFRKLIKRVSVIKRISVVKVQPVTGLYWMLLVLYGISVIILLSNHSITRLMESSNWWYLLLIYLTPLILFYLFILGVFLYLLVSSSIEWIKSFRYFNKIDLNKLNSREHIYQYYLHLKKLDSKKFLNKFFRLLESNSTKITGNWPNPDLLNVTSDHYVTRLAKLEEKWLEAEERTEETSKRT